MLRTVIMQVDMIFHYLRKAIAFTLFLFLVPIIFIQAAHAGELHFVLNGKSIHINKIPSENLNERNYGAGFQYEFNRINKNWVPFLNAGGFTDSYDKPSYYVGGGFFHRYSLSRNFLNLHFDAGLTGFVMTKEDVNDNEPFPGILPMVSIGNERVALNITYIPKITDIGTDLWFMQLKFSLGRF